MRKIIFRGKPKSGYNYGNGWLYGSLIQIDENNYGIVELSDISYDENGYIDYSHTPVISETVGQSTGLLDKNGREIYEGDIIKEKESDYSNEYRLYRIYWCDDNMQYWMYDDDTGDSFPLIELEIDYSKIIGNIHDNLSLLTNK